MSKVMFLLIAGISGMFIASCNEKDAGVEKKDNQSQVRFSEGYCDEGDDEESEPMLVGTVKDLSNGPLYHACVELQTTGGTPIAIIGTDITGHYYFNTVANGSYLLVASMPGYTSQVQSITVSGTPQTVNFNLP